MTNLSNFRELGGIAVKSGNVKYNKIYRGGPLSDLLESDKSFILSTGIQTIYDLRSDEEVNRNQDEVLEGITHRHLDITKYVHGEFADPQKL